jgi:hypothetical protein
LVSDPLHMTQVDLRRHAPTLTNPRQSKPNVGYIPRQFNALTRGRFLKARRKQHLARVPGRPSDAQIEMARSMAVLEWGALQAENEGTIPAMREAREHRRLLLRVIVDFERSMLPKAPAKPAKAKPRPPQIGIEEHLAQLGARHGAVVEMPTVAPAAPDAEQEKLL